MPGLETLQRAGDCTVQESRSVPTSRRGLWRVHVPQTDTAGTQASYALQALEYDMQRLDANPDPTKRMRVPVSTRCWYEPAFVPRLAELVDAHHGVLPRLLIEIEHECLLKSATVVRNALADAGAPDLRLAVRLGAQPTPLRSELRAARVGFLIVTAETLRTTQEQPTELLFLKKLATAAGAKLELEGVQLGAARLGTRPALGERLH